MLRRRPSHLSEAEANGYLDRQLAATALERAGAHLSACQPCRELVDGLGAVQTSLRSMPRAAAPRSFRLRQAQVETPARARQAALLMRLMPQLTGLSIVSAVVFVSLLGLNASGGLDSSEGDSALSVQSVERDTVAEDGAAALPEAAPDLQGAESSGDIAYNSATQQVRSSDNFGPPSDDDEDDGGAPARDVSTDDESQWLLYALLAGTAVLALASGGLAFSAWRLRNSQL